MKKIKVVTDSATGLPEQIRERYGITVVPIPIQIGKESFRENVDITAEEFYGCLDGKEIPKTSSPSPGDFMETYSRLSKVAHGIISVHVTARGSGTCQAAELAAESLPENVDVCVYDSNTVSMGTGFLSIEAAKAALEGLNLDQIRKRLDTFKDKIRAFVAIPTLKYLQKSGRVSKGQAVFGSILSIKPVIEVKDGLLEVVARVRSYPNALEKIIELASQAVSDIPSRVAVMHANNCKEAIKVGARLKKRLNIRNLIVSEIGASLAVHGGPGLIGIILLPD